MSCMNWCCLWAGISILSIWAELLAWRFLSAWSAFHQWLCPWVLKYGYLYSSLKLAEFPTSCDGCALAGTVYFSLLLCPSFTVFLWSGSSSFSHFMCVISSETFPPTLQPWRRGNSHKGSHWKWLCIFGKPFILQLLTLNQRMQYQFSAGSVVGAAVLVQPQLHSPLLKCLWSFGRQLCSSSSQPSGCLPGHCVPLSVQYEQGLNSELWCLTPCFLFSFRSPETGTWSSNLPTSKASKYW